MKKSLLSGLLIVGSFLLFNNAASATEMSTSYDDTAESADNIVYYDSDKQDILVTDEVIIRTIGTKNNLIQRLNAEVLNNGVWDLLGYENVLSKSSVWHSSGGDFKVEIAQSDAGPVFYQLFEQDEYIDDKVGQQFRISGSQVVALEYRNITSFVDGDNGLAEFYLDKLTHTSNEYLMAFYD